MSKNETYKSKKAEKRHERGESASERTKEYGMKGGKIKKIMHEWKQGTLHSGKGGKVVKSQKQAVAIAISQANKRGAVRTKKRKPAIEGK